MQLPHDMKSYSAPDAFQLIPAESVGWVLLTVVVLAMILEPVLR